MPFNCNNASVFPLRLVFNSMNFFHESNETKQECINKHRIHLLFQIASPTPPQFPPLGKYSKLLAPRKVRKIASIRHSVNVTSTSSRAMKLEEVQLLNNEFKKSRLVIPKNTLRFEYYLFHPQIVINSKGIKQ